MNDSSRKIFINNTLRGNNGIIMQAVHLMLLINGRVKKVEIFF